MNREIRFRGVLKGIGSWIYGDLIEIGNDEFIHVYDRSSSVCDNIVEVIPRTIGQFINKLCQNECELYESDIVSIDVVDCGAGEIVFEKLKFSVKYWIPEMKKPGIYGKKEIIKAHYMYVDLAYTKSKHIKILGNTFEHPELLEGG